MEEQKPLISIIMPAYNAEKYIEEAINSILNQTYKAFELIIVDDCSTDETVNIIKKYNDHRIRYTKNEINCGVAESLNNGLRIAKGEYIARMDSDDISSLDRLEKQLSYFEDYPECIICGSNARLFGAKEGKTFVPISDSEIRATLVFSSPFIHPTVMIKKAALNYQIEYDPRFEGIEDYELWTRLCRQNGRMHNFSECLLNYRIHPLQVTQKRITDSRRAKSVKLISSIFDNYGFGSVFHYPVFLDLFDSNESFGFSKAKAREYISELRQLINYCTDYLKDDFKNICRERIITVLLDLSEKNTALSLGFASRDILGAKGLIRVLLNQIKGVEK